MSKQQKCKTCYGYGMWAWGNYVGMGPLDAKDGMPTVECHECHANANPIVRRGKVMSRKDIAKNLKKRI